MMMGGKGQGETYLCDACIPSGHGWGDGVDSRSSIVVDADNACQAINDQ
jgi:hypothetical protein